jgi:hypothetical protein
VKRSVSKIALSSLILGCLGLLLCTTSIFKWIGVLDTTRTVDPAGRVWATDQQVFGVHDGIFYCFQCETGSEDMRFPTPTYAYRQSRDWGIVDVLNKTRPTTYGYSNERYPGVVMANQFYEAHQWSFPVWPIVFLLLYPAAALTLRIWRRRVAIRSGRCRDCGYNLAGNTSGVCPECGTPVAGKVGASA